MKSAPTTWQVNALADHLKSGLRSSKTGHPEAYVRPYGHSSIGNRLTAAWLVFTGRADALIWGQGQ